MTANRAAADRQAVINQYRAAVVERDRLHAAATVALMIADAVEDGAWPAGTDPITKEQAAVVANLIRTPFEKVI